MQIPCKVAIGYSGALTNKNTTQRSKNQIIVELECVKERRGERVEGGEEVGAVRGGRGCPTYGR